MHMVAARLGCQSAMVGLGWANSCVSLVVAAVMRKLCCAKFGPTNPAACSADQIELQRLLLGVILGQICGGESNFA